MKIMIAVVKSTAAIFLILCSYNISSQNTLGLISYDKEKSFDGYNLVFPHNQQTVFLLNNCGEICHTWPDSSIWRPGNTVYLTNDGKLIKGKRNKTVTTDRIWAGGGGAIVEIRDWDNKLEWSYFLNDSLNRLHHDIAPMPNGNILMIVWHYKNKAEMIAAGRDTSTFKEDFLLSDYIIEVNPKTNQVVWRWNMWDHMVQDYDPTKQNYGNVSQSPHKINFNYKYRINEGTWLHTNAIKYNAELDQILVSIPTFDEMWIIDHSTTTGQAAGSTGGLSKVGGDLMYRWGNPRTYSQDTTFKQTSFFQHDVQWVSDFIPANNTLHGNILFFNNQVGSNFSTVNFVSTPWDMYDWEYTKTQGVWGPFDYVKSVSHPEKTKLYSPRQSSVQLLPNNNVLIMSGILGYAFEVTTDQKIVWEYKIPLKAGIPVNQGSSLNPQDNLTFRMKRYPADFSGFNGKDLTPKGFIETMPNVSYCQKLVATREDSEAQLIIAPNPSADYVDITSPVAMEAYILDMMGIVVTEVSLVQGVNRVDVTAFSNGSYILHSSSAAGSKIFTVLR